MVILLDLMTYSWDFIVIFKNSIVIYPLVKLIFQARSAMVRLLIYWGFMGVSWDFHRINGGLIVGYSSYKIIIGRAAHLVPLDLEDDDVHIS